MVPRFAGASAFRSYRCPKPEPALPGLPRHRADRVEDAVSTGIRVAICSGLVMVGEGGAGNNGLVSHRPGAADIRLPTRCSILAIGYKACRESIQAINGVAMLHIAIAGRIVDKMD